MLRGHSSVFWETVIKTTDLFSGLKKPTDGSAFVIDDSSLGLVCPACPCDETAWYIVCFCPCTRCMKVGRCFIGNLIGDEFSLQRWPGDDEDYVPRALDIPYTAQQDSRQQSTLLGQINTWPVVWTVENCRLWLVSHTTPMDAPVLSGTIDATLYVDGGAIKGYSESFLFLIARPIVIGGEFLPYIDLSEEGNPSAYTFGKGAHNLDLYVEIKDNNGVVLEKYTCRVGVVCVGEDADGGEWIGTPVILRREQVVGEDGSDCPYTVPHPSIPFDVNMFPVILKGPFDSHLDASLVCTYFKDLIEIYSATCACDTVCPAYIIAGDNVEESLYVEGELRLWYSGTGTGGLNESWKCDYGWGYYDVTLNEDVAGCATITPRLADPFGNVTDAPWEGLIPPCYALYFAVDGVQNGHWFGEVSVINGSAYPVIPGAKCALEDVHSPYSGADWDYDMDAHTGVPGNSEELLDYISSLMV